MFNPQDDLWRGIVGRYGIEEILQVRTFYSF